MKRLLIGTMVVVALGSGLAIVRSRGMLPWSVPAKLRAPAEHRAAAVRSRTPHALNEVPWASDLRPEAQEMEMDEREVDARAAKVIGPMLANLSEMESNPAIAANPELMSRIQREREKILGAVKGAGK
jgi:hypothetical protein